MDGYSICFYIMYVHQFFFHFFSVDMQQTLPKVPFMDNIKSEIIFHPGEEPDWHDDEVHPSWEKVKKVTTLVDPINGKAIAHWSTRGKAPYFNNRGYLRINPDNRAEHKFLHDPDELPYKKPKGSIIFAIFPKVFTPKLHH